MRILIIRHGDPDYAIDSLTEKGWREAECLSHRLCRMNIRDFYVSPLGRAQATLRPTLEKTGRSAETLDWLHEFSGTVVNPFDGNRRIPWNLMPQYWTRKPEYFENESWLKDPFIATGNVEDVYREAVAGVDQLLARYGLTRDGMVFRTAHNTTDTIALVCHFGLGMVILSHLTGVSVPVLWGSFFLPTSSVTTLITEERIPGEVFFKCLSVGDTSHLYAEGEPISRSGLFPEVTGCEDTTI